MKFAAIDRKISSYLLIGLALAGATLSLIQFFSNTTLWVDEAMLANNIVDRSFYGLFDFLDNGQSAPIGFLMVEKLFLSVFGVHEMSLRLFPMLAFFVSGWLLYRIALILMNGDKQGALLVVSLFFLNKFLISYSSESKQYMMDVFASLVVIFCTMRPWENRNRVLWCLSLAGVIGIWFSNIVVISLTTCGLIILYQEVYRKKDLLFILPIGMWLVSFGVYYVLFIHNNPLKDYMTQYWQGAFLPADPFSYEFYAFIHEAFEIFSRRVLKISVSRLSRNVSLLLAMVFLIYKNWKAAIVLLVPFILHLFLSAFELYPFAKRLVLYQMPLFILTLGIGIYFLWNFIRQYLPVPKLVFVIFPLLALLRVHTSFPSGKEELNQSLEYLLRHRESSELVYVYKASRHALEFYYSKGNAPIEDPVIMGEGSRADPRSYAIEIPDESSIWLLFSHMYTFEQEGLTVVEAMLGDLRNRGYLVEDHQVFEGSEVIRLAKVED